MRRQVPWSTWVVGWLAAIVLAGGVAEAVARSREPEVETVTRTVRVLPEGQAKVTGTLTSLTGSDVSGPVLALPVVLEQGTATIDNAGETIVWDGGRPFHLEGDGGIDLGPTEVAVDGTGTSWSLDGVRVLLPGRYEVRTPVAVGRGGLAEPHDAYAFTAGDDATLATEGAVRLPLADLHLEGPGSLVLDGRFEVRTRDGRRTATHLEFGPGPFVLDVGADLRVEATLQGPLRQG